MARKKIHGRVFDKYVKKHPFLKRRIITFILIVLVLLGGLGVWAINYLNNSFKNSYKSVATRTRKTTKVIQKAKPISILLLGTDTGELNRTESNFGNGRTDTIMIATINPSTKTTTLISLPRDTMASVPGYSSEFPQKLNAAYADSGVAGTIKTIQEGLNIPIDFYALVNMKSLTKVVDKIGGIQVTSPLSFTFSPETAHSYGTNLYRFTKGSSVFQHSTNGGSTWTTETTMNGQAALAFSRMRYDDPNGDYGRTQRQRMVITAILKKAESSGSILNQSFISSIFKSTQTNIKLSDALSLLKDYKPAIKNIKSDHMQGTTLDYQGQDFEVIKQEEKQRITNEIRSQLDLSATSTGYLFFGNSVPSTNAAFQAGINAGIFSSNTTYSGINLTN